MRNAAIEASSPHDCAWRPGSGQAFELIDELGDYRQAFGPEGRIGRVKAEGGKQLAMPHRAACAQHFEIALREALMRGLVTRIKRVHQTIAESIGIYIERRVDEMRDVGPVMAVDAVEAQCRAEALALHRQPDLAEPVRSKLGLPPLVMHPLLESGKGDLPHDRVQHVLDFAREHDLAPPRIAFAGE